MNVELQIESLVIDAASGQGLNLAKLKTAVERELTEMIETGGSPKLAGRDTRLDHLRPAAAGPPARGETDVACELAARIFEAILS
jgi:hypothetical protein